MKKFIIINILSLVIFLALWAGLQHYFSGQTEHHFKQMIALIDVGPGVEVKLQSYEKGFFKSTAQTEVILTDKKYLVNHIIFHGPLIINFQTKLFQFAVASIESKVQSTELPMPLSWTTTFPFTGGADVKTEGAPFEYKHKQSSVHSLGWTGSGKIAKTWDAYTLEYVFPEFKIINNETTGQPLEVTLKNFKTEIEQKNGDDKVLVNVHYFLSEVQSPQSFVTLNNIATKLELTIRKEVFDAVFLVNLDKVLMGNQPFGPFVLQGQIENLDKALFKSLILKSEKKLNNPNENENNTENKTENKPAQSLDDKFQQLLLRKLHLKINTLLLNLPQGSVNVSGDWTLGGETLVQPITVDAILKTLDGKLNARVAKDLFRFGLSLSLQPALEKNPEYNTFSDLDKKTAQLAALEKFILELKQKGILQEEDSFYLINLNLVKGNWIASGSN